MECHSPYLPPRPYNDYGPIGRLLAGRDTARFQTGHAQLGSTLGTISVPCRSRERLRHLYARSVRSMDDWLGRFLEKMQAARLLDDTLVLVVSDHGENLGEEGLFGHQLSLDDRLIKVPMVAGGGVVPPEPTGIVSLADVPRLVAQGLGITGHPWDEPTNPDGAAVASYDGFASFHPDQAERMARRAGIPEERRWVLYASADCATDGRFKLVRTNGQEVLHDLASDPLETMDVSSAHPHVAGRLRRALDGVLDKPSARIEVPDDLGKDPAEVAELEERMRVLGYL